MPTMVGTPISKGAMNKKWDEMHSTQEGRKSALEDLKKSRGKPIPETLLKLKLISKRQAEHLEKHWLADEPPGWWPEDRPKADILREGYIKALEIAVARNLPTDNLWVCTAKRFSVWIAPSKHQVTIIVATPGVPWSEVPSQAIEMQDLYVVGDDEGAEYMLQPYEENWMHAPDPKKMIKPKKSKTGAKDVNVVQVVWP